MEWCSDAGRSSEQPHVFSDLEDERCPVNVSTSNINGAGWRLLEWRKSEGQVDQRKHRIPRRGTVHQYLV